MYFDLCIEVPMFCMTKRNWLLPAWYLYPLVGVYRVPLMGRSSKQSQYVNLEVYLNTTIKSDCVQKETLNKNCTFLNQFITKYFS